MLQEIGHPNHFTLVEKWVDQKAYDDHNIVLYTCQFRDQLQPMPGLPFDERLHTELTSVRPVSIRGFRRHYFTPT